MPKLLANQRLSLVRFWNPFLGTEENQNIPTIRLYDGILPDPEDSYGKLLNPNLQTLAEIEKKRCFALLGQPGLGKSIAVAQWSDDLRARGRPEDAFIHFVGRELAAPEEIRFDTIQSAEWRRARSNNGQITLILDGLDEALQRLPLLLSTLQKCLRNEPPDQTRVVLVSRVADWRDSRAEQLFALWPEADRGGAFELCPLRWRDVRLAATKSNLNADKFQAAVLERRVAWMAGRPKLLLMLLEEFGRFRRLPDSRRELFYRGAMRMCEEHDPERHEVLERSQRPVFAADHLFPIIERIAATVLLSGKSYVLYDQDADVKSSDLSITDIIDGSEPLPHGIIDVDKPHVLAALDTSHFVACGPGRLGFDHHQMAEFMAAQYLRRCTARQLRNLLTQRVDGQDYLSPQFREISAWIALQHPEFRSYVVRREPRTLLEADSVALDDRTRAAGVAGLLAQLEEGEATDTYLGASFRRALAHPFLAKQLRPYITSASHNIVVRRTAILIAGTVRCTSLTGELWRLVAIPQQPSVLHSALAALESMGSEKDKRSFLNVLQGKLGPEVDEELKGVALRFLVPKYLPVSAVLKYLTPRNENLIGAYYGVLHHDLPEAVRASDVVPILREYERRRKFGRTGPIHPTAVAAVKFALRHFNHIALRRACIRFLATELQNHGWEGTWEALRPSGTTPSTEVKWRRALLEGFVRRANGRYISFLRFNLWPAREDFAWVLRQLRSAKGAEQRVWAHLAARLTFDGVPADIVPQFHRTYNAVPAFRKKLPQPRRFDLEETLRRRARAVELWREVWHRRSERRKAKEAKGRLSIGEVLEHFPNGELKWWIIFVRVLTRLQRDEPGDHRRSIDLTTSASWNGLSATEKKSVKKMAARFLLSLRIPNREPSVSYVADEAAVWAMVFLFPSIRRSSSLRLAIRQEWISAILNDFYNAEPELERLSCLAYQLDFEACLDWCKREIRRLTKQGASLHSLRRFQHCWDRRLTELVSRYALRQRQKPRRLAYCFALLREMAAADAANLWRTCWERSIRTAFDDSARMLTFLGLFVFPDIGWNASMQRVRKCSRAGQIRLFAQNVHLLSYDFGDWFENLDDRQLGELYELLADLFPPHKLRDYARGGSVRARDHFGDTQRACLNVLIQRGTASARSELRRLSVTVAEENRLWMKWRLREAIDQRLRTKWIDDQPSPATIMRMVRSSDALRVRDTEELQEAIICSLTRLQSLVHVGEFPKVPDFWLEPGSRPKSEREIARVVAAWLQRDLCGDAGVVVDRETQVGFRGNVDIKVEVPATRIPARPRLRVIIEVKRCTHRDVQTACATQLAEGYLRRKGIPHGVYLVAWFDIPSSQIRWTSLADAEKDVTTWTFQASNCAVLIRGFVLDCRWKDMESPSSLARRAVANMKELNEDK